ncbi:hypothetical protein H112_03744 [Trichophyton rubrum D6]|uniref:Uncharacterized protein n=3 Tax=Trichophyton TaxID=5550 RepID=A0A178EX41_TRIRU|nr:hypothetical protein H100_03753 [Trichophyton rubrum MR850]EZF42639.1 hypothetical protein H102_03742 [Trichophyton rubrum CBS 100081]EZF53284.1 hypothetical protein H103_03755 [Trichophyton rubrum CBS 288.86]EZF63896.1 hypothetical protein H104_03741 [Trichophyton rubrum CBS 289.86]EZF74572.1 hypothetical protein H105_03769 [Trichophyton soudanense CBS 452.61]EZF95962.1 hypothetical protein H113_03778 [Trichophyton rubrum MR1459]EZG17536.1 hypothetical protein H107_03861 [Trichophyton rub
MAHENHIDWRPLTQKVLEKWALASGPELPEPRHCTISSPSRLRESGPYAVAYFYLVTAAEPGPWYVIESALWDTEKNFKLREATFIVPCRDPPSASHPFVCEWDNGLHVYIVRHLKGAKNLTVVKEATKKNSKKKPRKSPKKKPQKMEDDYPSGMESYDGTSDEPEGSSRHTTNGQQDSIGDVLDTQPRASPHDGSPADEKPSDSEKMAASNEEESSSSSPESDACDEDTPASSQSHDNIGNSSSEKPMDTDDFDTDDFDTDEIDTEVPSFFKYSESDEEEDIQGYNAADYECCRQDTELSEEALDEIYSRDQAQDEKTAVHHYNFFGDAMPARNSTPPEVSLFVLMQGPKCWSHEGSCVASLMNRAIKYIDPVLYTGPLEALSYAHAPDILKGITGHVHKLYTGHGTWVHDKVKRGKKRPVLDSTDSDSYYVEPWLPFNGLLNPHWRCWSRKDFKNGMCERGVPKRIRIRPTPMSPLSQCVLASEI